MNRAMTGAAVLREAAMRLPEQARNRLPGRAQRPGDVGRNTGAQARTAQQPWRVLLLVALIGAMFALAQSERTPVQASHGIELQPIKGLNEWSLDGAGVDIVLTNGDRFAVGAGIANIGLQSDVAGLSVATATLDFSRTTMSLKLAWAGADFDTSGFLEIDLQGSAVDSGTPGTSDRADIGYLVEGVANADGIVAAAGPWDPGRPSEGALQPSVEFIVTLEGGTFIGPDFLAGLTLIQELGDQPHGFTLTDASPLDIPTTALRVTVTKDASDYDIDTPSPLGGLLFRVDPSIHSGAAVADAGRFWPGAVIESATLTQVGGGNPIEADLDGATLLVILENNVFTAAPLVAAGFETQNWPPGLTIAGINRSSNTTAELTLAFTGADFNTDFDGFLNVVAPNVAFGDPTTTTSLRFEAVEEGPPGGGGAFAWIRGTADESTLDGAIFTVGLDGRVFDGTPVPSDFQFLGTINVPTMRITVNAVTLLSPTRVELQVDYPGVDFDQDQTLSVLVDAAAMVPAVDALLTGETTVTGINETGNDERAFISATNPSPLTEANLDGATVTVDLVGASYKVGVGIADFLLLGPDSPPGDSIVSLTVVSLTRVILDLAYNGTDFDVDTDLKIRVRNSATEGSAALATGTVPVTAVIEAVTLALSPAAPPLIETGLDGAILFVDVSNGESVWVPQVDLDPNLFSLNGQPDGLTIDTVTRTSGTRVTVALAFDGTDFDVDAAMSLLAKPDAFEAALATATTNTVPITAVIEASAPSITAPANQTILEDGTTGPLAYVATDPDPGPLTVTATSSNQALVTNASLAANLTQPGGGSTVEVIGQPDANGVVTITLTVSDGSEIDIDTFTVTVTAVNDEPSFTKGANETVLEDAGAQTEAGWATAISAGPPDEAGQTLTFEITNNTNAALFAAGPAVAANGTLTYAPVANVNGTATITLRLTDDGGTANGGDDTLTTQTFMITVTPVNDEPTVMAPANQTIAEDGMTAVLVYAVVDIDGDLVTVTATSDDQALVTDASLAANLTQPGMDTIKVVPVANANGGPVTITLTVTDSGGLMGTDTFTVTVTPVIDATIVSTTPVPLNEDSLQGGIVVVEIQDSTYVIAGSLGPEDSHDRHGDAKSGRARDHARPRDRRHRFCRG